MISQEQIQQVKDQTDIVQLIGSYIDLKKAGSGHKGLCPFHNEKSPSFNVSAQNQFFHCFGCGESGSVFNFLMKIEGLQFMEALNQLADQAGITLINDSTPQQRQKMAVIKEGKERIKDLMKQASQWYMQQLHTSGADIARQYLNQRGIDSETIRQFGLGYSPDAWDGIKNWAKSHSFSNYDLVDAGLLIVPEGKNIEQGYDRFRGRLMFPIWDDAGNVVGFSARTLKDENAKYINSPETAIFNKSKVLYAFPYAKAGFRQH
ncbi:MAG: DNA primase, partial [Lentisphaeria bacterium]|nr:DNA primase [Lentisphaeria bacterium]